MAIPLFAFPPELRILIVKCMELSWIALLSMCSKRSKRLVKSTNTHVDRIHLRINESPKLYIQKKLPCQSWRDFSVTFRKCEGREWQRKSEQDPRVRFELPMTVDVAGRYDFVETERRPGYWMSHFLDIFHQTKGLDVILATDIFVPESIKEALRGVTLDKVEIHANTSNREMDPHNVAHGMVQAKRMGVNCDIFYPRTYAARQKFHMFTIPEVETAIARLMIQNFQVLCLDCCRVTTEHLASMNCEYFTSRFCHFYPREIHRFLKMWMHGAAPRLKYIDVSMREPFTMDGIEAEQVAEDVERPYRAVDFHMEFEQRTMKGGFDIRRNDNTKATIKFNYRDFRMVVWQ